MDLAWALTHMCPTKLFQVDLNPLLKPEVQTVPGWSAFCAMVSEANPQLTQIGYCPMIAASPTEFSTVYTVMKQVQKMMRVLGQQESVITFDLAIYVKAKELQFRHSDEFKDTVVRLGGFHIVLNFLAVIGKRFMDSGLQDLLIESNIYGSSTALALLRGTTYNRGVRAHKLLMEAMLRLQWHSFSEWIKEQELNTTEVEQLYATVKKCQESALDKAMMQEHFNDLWTNLTELHQVFMTFKCEASMKSHLFAYWDSYIQMVELLLEFIRAERNGHWLQHLSATAGMMPHFFSMDRTNYSRWLPIYLADMNRLPVTHPRIHEEFVKGNHTVSRSTKPFSQVWTDMALEQSINLDSKKGGGIIGITQRPAALERWFLTSHERAAITSATKQMCGLQENERVGSHKESGTIRVTRDEAYVQQLLSVFTSDLMTNPFSLPKSDEDACLPLVNIASGVIVPANLTHSFVHAEEIGRQHMEKFVSKRLDASTNSFWSPLPRLNLKTFSTLTKQRGVKSKDEKMKAVNADRELFGRLIIASKYRDVDLKEVLTYELSSVPISLAHLDGTLRKNVKSVLLAELEKKVPVPIRIRMSDEHMSTSYIIDGMATVQMVKRAGASTFGELATIYWGIFTSPLAQVDCNRVVIVWDRYDKEDSIKAGERIKRGSSTALEIKIAGENTPVPRQWDKYISNPANKSTLVAFLNHNWYNTGPQRILEGKVLVLAGGFENGLDVVQVMHGHTQSLEVLRSDHEEADTRMMLHALNASQDHTRVVIQSPDTDVAVLGISFFSSFQCTELWFRTGVKDKLRHIPLHQVADRLGPTHCSALPGFHALTVVTALVHSVE